MERSSLEEQLKHLLLQPPASAESAAITAVEGFGGTGKTTLVDAVIRDPDVRSRFSDGIVVVSVGQEPTDLTKSLIPQLAELTGTNPSSLSAESASAFIERALTGRAVLLVFDDVWKATHIAPFLAPHAQCRYLITTTQRDSIPHGAMRLSVGMMKEDESRRLLLPRRAATEGLNLERLDRLAEKLGRWPLLLRLVRSRIQAYLDANFPLSEAVELVEQVLRQHGMGAFDADAPGKAVGSTLEVCLGPLGEREGMRFSELGCFVRGREISLRSIERLWRGTAGLTAPQTAELCLALAKRSLLEEFDARLRVIRLHDVISEHLEAKLRADGRLATVNASFLDTYNASDWSILDLDDPIWDSLGHHLVAAGRKDEWASTLTSLPFLSSKIWARGPAAAERDLASLDHPDTAPVRDILRRYVANSTHVLGSCEDPRELRTTLLCRIAFEPALAHLVDAATAKEQYPVLCAASPLPDLPSRELVRTMSGHTDRVYGCDISADATLLASASDDRTVRVWSVGDGASIAVLRGHHSRVFGCSISESKASLASASEDRRVLIWDLRTGACVRECIGHEASVWKCCFFDRDRYLLSCSEDGTLRVWDTATAQPLAVLRGHQGPVCGCAVLDPDHVVSAAHDGRIGIWKWRAGEPVRWLTGHEAAVWSCAVNRQLGLIASSSVDTTVRVWNSRTGGEVHRFAKHEGPVWGCAISRRGGHVVSASEDATLRVWSLSSGGEKLVLRGHTSFVWDCALDVKGRFLASASLDATVRLWMI